MKYTTGTNSIQAGEKKHGAKQVSRAVVHDFERQALRILRCTAQALASSRGGLCFEAGSRPWLQGLSAGLDKAC